MHEFKRFCKFLDWNFKLFTLENKNFNGFTSVSIWSKVVFLSRRDSIKTASMSKLAHRFHQNLNISLTTNLAQVVYYFISTEFTERSAAPQTAPWRDTWPRFEPRTGLALSVLNQLHNSLPPAPESADDESDHVVAGRGDNRHQGSHADHHQSYHSIRFKSEISQHECITKINV